MKKLEIEKIRTDGGTQMRAELDEATVAEYSELFANGVELEAIEVFFDGMAYWLADGFQRVAAACDAGLDKILAHVTTGTRRDAILYACGANANHGLRRTNPDKRRAVETLLNDEEWVTWSDRKIADAAGVSDMFVGKVRKELQTVCSSPAAKAADKPRVGTDGKSRKAPAPKADREPKATPKHVVDTPAEEKRKITGGTAFNVEELGDDPQPKTGKPKSHFDDSRFERAYGPLVKVVAERNAWLGQRKSVGFQRTDKALGELLAAWKDWQKKEPV